LIILTNEKKCARYPKEVITMKKGNIVAIVSILMLLSACVSSKEYKARLADIDDLKLEAAAQNEKITAQEEQITALEKDKEVLREEISNLKSLISRKEGDIEQLMKEKEDAIKELKSTYNSFVSELQNEIKQGQIEITQLKDKLSLTMVEKILFDSGSAAIKKEGQEVLSRIGEILSKVKDKQITIQGHTDNVPISSKLRDRFPSNWELSAARATTVVRYLQEKANIDPRLLIAAGVGEFRPVASNDTAEGRAKNRRIEIVLLPLDFDITPRDQE
jgi:chemotaxis protein MotB